MPDKQRNEPDELLAKGCTVSERPQKATEQPVGVIQCILYLVVACSGKAPVGWSGSFCCVDLFSKAQPLAVSCSASICCLRLWEEVHEGCSFDASGFVRQCQHVAAQALPLQVLLHQELGI